MRLSLVILTCDRDYEFVSDLLKNISDNIQEEYEVIIMDNREKFKDVKVDWNNVKIHSYGENVGQLKARLDAMDEVEGDYVWYIDADDLVLKCPSIDVEEDLIVFDYCSDISIEPEHIDRLNVDVKMKDDKLDTGHSYNKEELLGSEMIERPILPLNNITKIYPATWNKLIKRIFLRSIRNHIQNIKFPKCNCLGNDIFNALLLQYASGIYYDRHGCYFYNREHSLTDAREYTYEKIKTSLKEFEDDLKFLYELSSKRVLDKRVDIVSHIQDIKCKIYVDRIFRIKDNDEFNESMELLLRHFDKELIYNCICEIYFSNKNSERKNLDDMIELFETMKEMSWLM